MDLILFLGGGGLLLRKQIKEWGLQERLVKLSLCDISTTGPPQEGAGRYSS